MKYKLLFLIIISIIFNQAMARRHTLMKDSYLLAVESLGANDTKTIKFHGAEHKMFAAILRQVVDHYPLLGSVYKVRQNAESAMLSYDDPRPMHHLWSKIYISDYMPADEREKKEQRIKMLQGQISKLFAGCKRRVVETTKISDERIDKPARVAKIKSVTYTLRAGFGRNGKKCTNPLVKVLVDSGISLAGYQEERGRRDEFSVILSARNSSQMSLIKNKLLESSELNEFISTLEVPKMHFSRSSNIFVQSVDLTKEKYFIGSKVRLEFYWGWGGCPAGCMNKHYWVLDAVVKKAPRNSRQTFAVKVKLVSERGPKAPVNQTLTNGY